MNARNAHAFGVPGYRLIRWIGAGGAAAVYAAVEISSERLAAVKIFHRVDAGGVARLEHLLQANAQLSHPNIVRVHQIGHAADGRLFHSMPMLLGFEQTRHELLGRPFRIAALLHDLLDGLDQAHRCGMVHGDIKPSNVLFDRQGQAHLADFGIARCMTELGLPRPEATRYLSPEQARGDPPDSRSDIYSVGALAYELLASAPPSTSRSAAAPASANAGQPVPQLPPRLSAWQGWIERALAHSPEQRFQSAQEMAEALGGISMGGIDGHRGRGDAVRSAGRRRAPKWMASAALVLVAAIVALAVWATWRHGRGRAPATAATTLPTVANAANPALPTKTVPLASALPLTAATASQPAVAGPSSQPVATGTASQPADRAKGLVAAADGLRASGHLFSPPFNNAASDYLAALSFDPGNRAATAGIDALLVTLRTRLDKAWDDNRRSARAVDMLRQGDALARHASAPARRAWRDYRGRLARQVGAAVVVALNAHDSRKIAALEPLAKLLHAEVPAGFDIAKAKALPGPPVAGERMRDPGGPLLVYVPASGKGPAFAIAQVEVTRADYAAFARATHRPAADCRAAHNPFSRLRNLTWRAPGFAQGGDHPVVCVSWNDAVAYAAWLSKATGKPYRLPSSAEWLRAARGMPQGTPCQLGNVDDASRHTPFDDDRWSCDDGAAETAPVGHYAPSGVGAYDMYGNVSEWLAGGAPGSRPFRGLSWRDGSHETPLGSRGTADSDIGYTSVGFRVVRVVDAAHPAPPAVSRH